MREIMLNSERLLDENAVSHIRSCYGRGLLNCAWIRFNEKIKVAYFTKGYHAIAQDLDTIDRQQLIRSARSLLHQVQLLEAEEGLSPENLILDADSIYVNEKGWTGFIYMPATLPESPAGSRSLQGQAEAGQAASPAGQMKDPTGWAGPSESPADPLDTQTVRTAPVYMQRVYAALEELFIHGHADEPLRAALLRHAEQVYGDWASLEQYLKEYAGMQADPEEWFPEVLEEPDDGLQTEAEAAGAGSTADGACGAAATETAALADNVNRESGVEMPGIAAPVSEAESNESFPAAEPFVGGIDPSREIAEISQVHKDLKQQIADEEKPFLEDTDALQEKLLKELEATLEELENPNT